MPNLTSEGLRIVTDVATRHGVSLDVALTLLGALAQGNGRQAQFNHPELGGMGQWSLGGMIMIGDMFNQGLKHRVDALCNELADFLRSQPLGALEAARFQLQSQSGGEEVSLYETGTGSASGWWPEELGSPPAPKMICDTAVFLAGAELLSNRAGGSVSTTPASTRFQHSPSDRAVISRLPSLAIFGLVHGGTDLALISPQRGSLSKPVIPLRFRDAPRKCLGVGHLQWLAQVPGALLHHSRLRTS